LHATAAPLFAAARAGHDAAATSGTQHADARLDYHAAQDATRNGSGGQATRDAMESCAHEQRRRT
jgi:hypothetical protein